MIGKMMSRRALLHRLSALMASTVLPHPAFAKEEGASAYQSMILAAKPTGYWPLRSINGSAVEDRSPNQHHGRVYGHPRFSADGMTLDGHSYVEIPHHADLNPANNPAGFSVEAWIRPDMLVFPGETANPYIHWLGKGEPGQQEWAFRFYSQETDRPNRLSAYRWLDRGGQGAGAYVQDVLTAGTWLHIVACYQPMVPDDPTAGVLIYKNGVLRGGPLSQRGARYASYNLHATKGSAPLRFGTRDRASFLRGGLRDVAIYPRVLSLAEIESHYLQDMQKV